MSELKILNMDVEQVIQSDRLPTKIISKYLELIVERSICEHKGNIVVSEWAYWAKKWLSGEDRTADSAWEAARVAVNTSKDYRSMCYIAMAARAVALVKQYSDEVTRWTGEAGLEEFISTRIKFIKDWQLSAVQQLNNLTEEREEEK